MLLGGEGGARDQAAWDDLFNKFIECGEDWSKSELVCKSVSVREKSQTGTWALMSKKESHLNLYTAGLFNIMIQIYIYG